jgi:uncharacterized protein YbaR (Trm112 family)
MGDELGRLKRTTKSKCPDCHVNLQLRSRGEKQMGVGRYYDEEYLYCSHCGEEYPLKREVRRKRNREGGDDD